MKAEELVSKHLYFLIVYTNTVPLWHWGPRSNATLIYFFWDWGRGCDSGKTRSPSDQMKTNLKKSLRSVPASGWRTLLCLITGLRVSDDLPAGGGAAHVGGTPIAARSCQEAKAAADRVEKTGLRSDLYSGITAKYSPGLQEISGQSQITSAVFLISFLQQRRLWITLIALALCLMSLLMQNAVCFSLVNQGKLYLFRFIFCVR